MTLTLLALLITGLMPVVCAGISKSGFKGYDNHNPRQWLARQEGWRARAYAAQQNSWEALALFGAALLGAIIAELDPMLINTLSGVFLVARVAYLGCYLYDKASLRSLVWLIGFGACMALLILALMSLH
ncbi:MAG: hypothetical protein EXR88_02405 [Gammaproteobacteria bacterium]|nr:hypothetical protein [Gammaproteobacteria bacterium]